MDLDMVLNELSFGSPASNVETAKQQMSNLREVAQLATEYGVNEALRVRSQFYATVLAPSYSVSDWLDDSSVSIEERLFFNALITKSPFLDEPREADIEEKRLLSDFFYDKKSAEGLGLAYLSESLAFSARTDPPDSRWEPSIIEFQHIWLEAEDDDNINAENVRVVHASQVAHIQEHIPWIQERLKTSVRNGLELWQRKDALFPNLEFCENARKQIQDLNYGDKMLRPVVKRLLQLEQYCKTWETGAFDPKSFPKATQESKATLGDRKLREKRTFPCPDGEERVFSWHIRLTPGAWRIHFWPEGGKMIIGYIGRKLTTIKYPTP